MYGEAEAWEEKGKQFFENEISPGLNLAIVRFNSVRWNDTEYSAVAG